MRHARTSVAPAPSAVSEPTAVAAEPWTWPEAPGLPPQARDDGPWATEQVVPLATLLEPADFRSPSVPVAPVDVAPVDAPRSSPQPIRRLAVGAALARSVVRPLPSGTGSGSDPSRFLLRSSRLSLATGPR